MATQAMPAMIATAIRIGCGCPASPSMLARFGSMKDRLWPTMKVKEI